MVEQQRRDNMSFSQKQREDGILSEAKSEEVKTSPVKRTNIVKS